MPSPNVPFFFCKVTEDTLELSKKVEKSLRKLCDEMLVQRNGKNYVFLSHRQHRECHLILLSAICSKKMKPYGTALVISVKSVVNLLIKSKLMTCIVPFNAFYSALDDFIDHTHRIVITQAANNSRLDTFDVELLKVLFMIKHVNNFDGNVENLTTLMICKVTEDTLELSKKVEKSLRKLCDYEWIYLHKIGGILIKRHIWCAFAK